MKKLLLIGSGEAHAEVLRQMSVNPAANADITLATPSCVAHLSAMLPGLVAGHHARGECQVDLAPLATAAGVRVLADRVLGLDPERRIALTAGGRELEFDFASINVGAVSLNSDIHGLGKFALLARPADVFLQGWERVCELAQEGALSRLCVVGGGIEGVELILAMHHSLRRLLPAEAFAACGFSIVTAGERLLQALPEALGRAAEAACIGRGISLLRGAAVVEVERAALRLSNGAQLASDITVWAAGSHGPRWLSAAGLACDARGLPRVDIHLRSVSHKRIYASGSCAGIAVDPGAEASGSNGFRDGPLLAASLRQALAGEPPLPASKAAVPMSFVTLGSKHALAVRGALPVAAPAWLLWRYKAWRDRRFRRRFA
jgi:selenide,water dikinase